MLLEVALFLLGLALLLAGSDRAVRAAAELAAYYGVSTFFIGVTVVSVGTSVPEMTTSLYGAYYGAGDLVVGNIVGSEVAQITLAIGIVALVEPIVAERRNVLVYGSAMLLAMIVMMLTLEDGVVTRSEGVLMMLAYANFVYILYTNEGGEEVGEEIAEEEAPPANTLPQVAVGLVLVVIGGHLLVSNGVAIARLVGISELTVGLLAGLGTTTPEVVVAAMAARHDRTGGISVGALLGSNITDPAFSLGIGPLLADVAVSSPATVFDSLWYMLAVSVVVLGLMYWREGIDRRAAVACLLLYVPALVVV